MKQRTEGETVILPKIHWETESQVCDPLLQTDLDGSSIPTVTETGALQHASSQVCQASAQPLLLKHDEHMQWVVTEEAVL